MNDCDGFRGNQNKAKVWHKSKVGRNWHKEHAKKQWNNENRKKREIKKNCVYCNEEFVAYLDRARFCSRNCVMAEYRRTHPELKNYQKEYMKTYNPIINEKAKEKKIKYGIEYSKTRYNHDKQFRISKRLRVMVGFAFRYYTETGKILKSRQMGINYKQIIEHLKPFPEDLSLYHIDHIKPLCSFDLTNPEDIKKAFAPENHQWLLAFDNQSKGKKY